MCEGEKRRLVIEPNLAYGDEDHYDNKGKMVVPAGSTLQFDIELFGINPEDLIQKAPERKSHHEL